MFDALRTATAGMTAAATQAAVAAEAIATPEPASQGVSATPNTTPRIGYMPVPADPISAFAMLFAAEFAFKANAAVFSSASRMVEAIYKATDRE